MQDFNEISDGEITVACTNLTETLNFLRNDFNHKFSSTLELTA